MQRDDLGSLVEEFYPRTWAKWLTVAVFVPIGLVGLVAAVGIPIAIFTLPDVPLAMALPVAGIGVVLVAASAWFIARSLKWLGHCVEIRHGGVVRRWRNSSEGRAWTEVTKINETTIRVKGREMPRTTVVFSDGNAWEFDEEYAGYERLHGLLMAKSGPMLSTMGRGRS